MVKRPEQEDRFLSPLEKRWQDAQWDLQAAFDYRHRAPALTPAEFKRYQRLVTESEPLLAMKRPRSEPETMTAIQKMQEIRDDIWEMTNREDPGNVLESIASNRHQVGGVMDKPRPLRDEEEVRRRQENYLFLPALNRFDHLVAGRRTHAFVLRPEMRQKFEELHAQGCATAKEGWNSVSDLRESMAGKKLNVICDQLEALMREVPPRISKKRRKDLLRKYPA